MKGTFLMRLAGEIVGRLIVIFDLRGSGGNFRLYLARSCDALHSLSRPAAQNSKGAVS